MRTNYGQLKLYSLKADFHCDIISREILHSSNLIGFAQFSAKKVEIFQLFLISREIQQ